MDPINHLIEHGEEHGCVHLTELHEVMQRLELDDEEVETILERLEAHGVELTDDCSRAVEEDVVYTNAQVASATTDSLQLFLNEAGAIRCSRPHRRSAWPSGSRPATSRRRIF